MHLAIDLRFYKPEPYGLAVYINGLFTELTPLLTQQKKYTKITLILNSELQNIDLTNDLKWWPTVTSDPLFQIFYSKAKYYSILEQTTFLSELNNLKADLVYFFTFNFPVLYSKPFVYQVLDVTQLKLQEFEKVSLKWRLKVFLMQQVLKFGFNKSKFNLFLGSQTPKDCQKYLGLNFTQPSQLNYKPNLVIWSGLTTNYLTQNLANSQKEPLFNKNSSKLIFDQHRFSQLHNLKNTLKITKPYFLFVSVWKKHKNIERLLQAFNIFANRNNNKFQLVLAGSEDKNNSQLLDKIKANYQYQSGNIVLAQKIPTEDLICLQDGAEALVMPSLSEGLGMGLIEAASRMTPVICSDIFIFKAVLGGDGFYFDPRKTESIAKALDNFTKISDNHRSLIQENLYTRSLDFTWKKVADEVFNVLINQLK
jgi:glycosyltransferase involved in cell wall biosynthesis